MSKLNQMQARFQQKQLEEKEQKLVRMYETQQAHALKRVGGRTSNSLSQSTGKVRQMFEERRTKAGIDKSYPLQPIGISSKASKQSTNGGVVTTTSKTTTRNGIYKSSNHQESNGHTVRHEVTMEVRQKSNANDLPTLSKTHRFESDRILRDQNLNDEMLDEISHPDGFELSSIENVTAKLPNVGGSLPSQRQAAKLKENNNNNIVSKNDLKKTFDGMRLNGDSKVKISPVSNKFGNSVKSYKAHSPTLSNAGSTTPKTMKPFDSQNSTPTAQTPVQSKNKTPVEITPIVPREKPPMKKTPTSNQAMSEKPLSKTSVSSTPTKTVSGVPCKICKRTFDPERLEKHQTICAKASNKKRKPYDPVKHRIEGTEVAPFVKVQRKGNIVVAIPKSGPVKLKANNWRQKHEDFIKTIKAAKEAQAYVDKGGKLSDLPPPPPSENPDYVQCPHCNRRFSPHAAERHIPKCASFQFNKPKPGQSKKRNPT